MKMEPKLMKMTKRLLSAGIAMAAITVVLLLVLGTAAPGFSTSSP